jgi:Helix-turn-helix domain
MDVLKVLLWGFHRNGDGRCFPSYEAIAKAADRHRDTVCEAIRALEQNKILTWVHRLKRIRVLVAALFGPEAELRPQRARAVALWRLGGGGG